MAAFDKKGQNEQPYRSVSGLRPRGQSEAEQGRSATDRGGERSSSATESGTHEFGPEQRQVARLLDEAAQWMARVPQGPLREQLKLTLDRYQRNVRDWEDCPPSDAQKAILLQGVQILRSAIARATLTP